MIETIYNDDGSTSIKLARIINEKIQVKTYSNRAVYGADYLNPDAGIYQVGNTELTFFEQAASIQTSNVQYQYSDHCVAALHHALHQEGLSGRTVNVAVTLPLSQYYKGNGQKNLENINKKISNTKKNVTPLAENDLKPIIINEVTVYPEAIPALQPLFIKNGKPVVAKDVLSAVVDLGGTTLDIALFSGAGETVLRALSYPIGMFKTFELIKIATNSPNARDMQLLNLLETGGCAGKENLIDRERVTLPVMNSAANAVIDFLGDDAHNVDYVFLIGGGAELLSKRFNQMGIDNIIVDNPTQALVTAIANIGLENLPNTNQEQQKNDSASAEKHLSSLFTSDFTPQETEKNDTTTTEDITEAARG